ncbi:Cytochrome P450 4C1, partial [Pseudolycoriella hygida]
LKNKRKFLLASKFNGPLAVPGLGNTLLFKRRSPTEVITYFEKQTETYGSIYRIWIGSRLAFVVTDPKVCELVFSNSTKYLEKSSLYDFLIPWLGTGLLLSTGQKWHNRRKIITPAFHFKILEEFCSVFDTQSEILLNNLKKREHGDAFDITHYISLMALDVVCETAMGIKINAQTDAESSYVRSVHELTKIISTRLATLWQRNDFLFNLFSRDMRIKQDEVMKKLHSFTKNIIKKRRAQLIQQMESNEKSNGVGEALNKIFAEIQDVFGNGNESASYRKLQNLKYLEMVIKESMRLYPPVPIIGRKIEEEMELYDGRIVPAGSTFTINFFLMFRSP